MDWRPISTMPLGRSVLVRTIKGLERVASRPRRERVVTDGHGPPQLHCWSADAAGRYGDVVGVAWREIEE